MKIKEWFKRKSFSQKVSQNTRNNSNYGACKSNSEFDYLVKLC